MKKTLLLGVLISFLFFVISCSKDDNNQDNQFRLEQNVNGKWIKKDSLSVQLGTTVHVRAGNIYEPATYTVTADDFKISAEPYLTIEGWYIKGLFKGRTTITVRTSEYQTLQIPVTVTDHQLNIETQDSYFEIEGVNDTQKAEIEAEIKKNNIIPVFSTIKLTYDRENSGTVKINTKTNLTYYGSFRFNWENSMYTLYVNNYDSPYLEEVFLLIMNNKDSAYPEMYLSQNFWKDFREYYPTLTKAELIINCTES